MFGMAIKFSGVNIHAKDPVKAFDFYKGIGLTVKEEVAADSDWYGAVLDIDGADLWIWRDKSGGQTDTIGRMTIQIVIKCDDMDTVFKELRDKGYSITEPELMFYGGREMNLTDPDGNRILFLD
jgi:uncharacterized glyoxalase superfamily protein PhnB